jgi:hypothetical protein
MFEAFLVILAVAIVFGGILMWQEGLTLFAPRRAGKLATVVQDFCENRCQSTDGRCPLTGEVGRPLFCPLWKFVDDDHPTMAYGNPFDDQHHRAA